MTSTAMGGIGQEAGVFKFRPEATASIQVPCSVSRVGLAVLADGQHRPEADRIGAALLLRMDQDPVVLAAAVHP